MEEVDGSIPSSSTPLRGPKDLGLARFLGGFVAGEGCFSINRRQERFADGSPRLRFVFTISTAQRDRSLLVQLRDLLEVGAVLDRASRRPGWLPTSSLTITRSAHIRAAVAPFAAAFLPPSAKRRQFEAWYDRFLQYERDRPTRHGRGRSACSVSGCGLPVRGRGLCRSHYYRATGY